jgi:hypothetical protein
VITVRVHRQPVKEKPLRGRPIRTKKPLETRELRAEVVSGKGVYVYFPFNDDRLFNMGDGVGRGRMQDWVIDPADLALLHATAKK